MRFNAAETRSRHDLPDITSMVDVVFLLIIFFLTTSSLVQMTRAPIDLPEEVGEGAEEDDTGAIVINVTAEGDYIIEGDRVSLGDLGDLIANDVAKLSRRGEGLDVLIRADRAATLEAVNDIADILISANIKGWRIATRVPQGGGGGS